MNEFILNTTELNTPENEETSAVQELLSKIATIEENTSANKEYLNNVLNNINELKDIISSVTKQVSEMKKTEDTILRKILPPDYIFDEKKIIASWPFYKRLDSFDELKNDLALLNRLKRAGFKVLRDFTFCSFEDIKSLGGFGDIRMNKLKDLLTKEGIIKYTNDNLVYKCLPRIDETVTLGHDYDEDPSHKEGEELTVVTIDFKFKIIPELTLLSKNGSFIKCSLGELHSEANHF